MESSLINTTMQSFTSYITESIIPLNFPIMDKMMMTTPHLRPERFYNAVEKLRGAVQGKIQLNKAGFDEIKIQLNRTLEDVWQFHIWNAILLGKTRLIDVLTADEQTAVGHMGIGILAASRIYKKYSAKEKTIPAVWGVIIPLVREISPLQAALDIAKINLVVGRIKDPSAVVRETNPNQIRATCTWCNRNHAITASKKMTHHGYQRPGFGWQTASCDGIKYPCAEISAEGYQAKVKVYERQLEIEKANLAKLPNQTELTIRKYQRGSRLSTGKYTPVILKKPEDLDGVWTREKREWEEAMADQVYRLECNIKALTGEITSTNVQIKNWKAVALPTKP